MRVAVTGSSGLVGTALRTALADAGHEVIRLVRSETPAPDEVRWNVERGTIDQAALQDVAAIVHLAGENIGQRWTDETRRKVLESRVDGARLIAETAATLPAKPIILCASATGFYGDRGNEIVDET